MFSRRTGWKLTPNRFTEAQREMLAAGRELLDLTISNPTRAGLRYDADFILKSLSRPEVMDYDPQPKGLASAREAVVAYYREQINRVEINPESLVLTTSTSEGYSYIFRLLCNAGDEILVPKPSYPLFEFLADLEDVTLAPYPLIYDHGWQIDFPSLQKAVNSRTRAVVVVHPNNPTGSYVSENERNLLNSFCREHDLAVIADEVFLDYAHNERSTPEFCDQPRGPDLYPQRGIENLRAAADEVCLGGHKRSGSSGSRGHGTFGDDCGHLLVDECPHPVSRTCSP